MYSGLADGVFGIYETIEGIKMFEVGSSLLYVIWHKE